MSNLLIFNYYKRSSAATQCTTLLLQHTSIPRLKIWRETQKFDRPASVRTTRSGVRASLYITVIFGYRDWVHGKLNYMDCIIIKYTNYIICHGSCRYHDFDDVRPKKTNKVIKNRERSVGWRWRRGGDRRVYTVIKGEGRRADLMARSSLELHTSFLLQFLLYIQ